MKKPDDIVLVIAPCYSVNRPPLGISLVSGYLKEHSIQCELFDLNMKIYNDCVDKSLWLPENFDKWVEKKKFDEDVFPLIKDPLQQQIKKIVELSPEKVGLSVFSTNVHTSLYVAKRLKQKLKDTGVIFGGPQMKLEVAGRSDLFKGVVDNIVYSEGEKAFLDICLDKEEPAGTITPDSEGFKEPQYLAPGEFPLPDTKLFECEKYKIEDSFSYIFGRGCPNSCAYCEESNIFPVFRHVDVKLFRKHLEYLKKRGVKKIFFSDSQVNPSKKTFDLFLRSLISDIDYHGNLFAFDWIEKRHIRLLKEKGFEKITIGVESCSKRILKRMNKPLSVFKVLRILRWSKRFDLKVKLNFIVGFPSETWGDLFITMFYILVFSFYSPDISPVAGSCSALSGSLLGKYPERFYIKESDTVEFIEENGHDIKYRKKKMYVFNSYINILKRVGMLS